MVANKLYDCELRRSFVCLSHFSRGEVTAGSDDHLRRSNTGINPFSTWWYKRLFDTVMAHE